MSINHWTSMMKHIALDINSSKWVEYTEKFILGVVAVIIVVDLFLAFNDIHEDTISEVLQKWAYHRFFVITWAWGVLAGHLFLARDSSWPKVIPLSILSGLTIIIFVAGLFINVNNVSLPIQLALLILGAIAGYVLWPQDPVM